MEVPAMSNGAELRYGFKKAAAWNTAVALGAGNGFLGLDLSLKDDSTSTIDDSRGQLFSVDSTAGEVKCAGEVPAYLRYNDNPLWTLIAMIMGAAPAPTTHAAGTLSKDHVLTVAANANGLFGTLAAQVGSLGVEEIPSFKPTKAVLKWETGKPTQATISGPGTEVKTNGTNTAATFVSVTILERANRVYMGQTKILINGQSAAALSDTDKIGPKSIELTIERPQAGVYGSYVSGDASPRDLIDQPTGNGMFISDLKLQFPRTADLTGRPDLKNNTSKKCEIICTGPIIEGAIPYLVKFRMPHLKPKSYENPYAAGTIENSKEFHVLGATTAPTGMTGITSPVQIELTNTIATSLLA